MNGVLNLSFNYLHLILFLQHTTKRKVQTLPVAILRYRQTPITIQQGKPTPYGGSIHSHAVMVIFL